MPNWTDGDGGCDCPSGHKAGLGYHRVGESKCCIFYKSEREGNVAKKKEKKVQIKERNWIDIWCEQHVDKLKALNCGFAMVHPKHGIVNYDNVDLLSLIGKNRFIKRSIIKDCVHIDVAKVLRNLVSETKSFAQKEIEEAHKDCQKETNRTYELSKQEVEQNDSVKRADGLPDLDTPYIDPFENVPDDNEEDVIELPEHAKTSPHKQPAFEPYHSPRFNVDMVIDGSRPNMNRLSFNKMKLD